jgi:hypothetical protein
MHRFLFEKGIKVSNVHQRLIKVCMLIAAQTYAIKQHPPDYAKMADFLPHHFQPVFGVQAKVPFAVTG